MKWATALSENHLLGDAIGECASRIRDELENADLIAVFVSDHHSAQYGDLPDVVREHLPHGLLLGCSGGGVIGEGREVEHRPGVSITAASLPDVELSPFHIGDESLPDGDAPPEVWRSLVNVGAEDDPIFLMLADPFSIRGEHLLMGLDYAFPGSVKIGGLASGGGQAGANALYVSDEVYDSGVVGVAMCGDITVDAVVAQGCRPIGPVLYVTSCEGNILKQISGKTPFEVLKDVFEELDERDRQLAQNSLFLGVVMDELNEEPGIGDFLIRNIIGADAREGALAVGEMLKEGQTVQFHLRDAETSGQDLDAMLAKYVDSQPIYEDAGAMLFSCLGRGSYLYGRPDHDTGMFRERVGGMPLTGFFCNGEIGPVGGSTFLHGYTSSFGIFRPKRGE